MWTMELGSPVPNVVAVARKGGRPVSGPRSQE